MLVILVWIIELLSIFICMYTLYARQIKINTNLIINFILMIATLLIVNFTDLPNIYSFISYIFLCVFCCLEYKERVLKAIISIVLCIIIISVIQFFAMILLSFISFNNLDIRDLCGSIITFLLVKFFLPVCKLNKLREAIFCRHWVVYLIYFFVISVVIVALFILKNQNAINLGLFIFGIPSIAIILFLFFFWEQSMISEKNMKKEISTILLMQKNYEDLVKSVRMNQHSMKNHFIAVKSTKENRELCSDDEKEYYDIMYSEAKYNSLLFIENHTLIGFLFEKMREAENKNIEVVYKIKSNYEKSVMPIYYLIEVLGILFDNAIEAASYQSDLPEIYFEIDYSDGDYIIKVMNTHGIVQYAEIQEWFELGKSTKGGERGIGLYRVKQICEEWCGKILCQNIEMNNKNWIQFKLIIGIKKDGE